MQKWILTDLLKRYCIYDMVLIHVVSLCVIACNTIIIIVDISCSGLCIIWKGLTREQSN